MKNKRTLILGLTTGCSIALVGTAVSLALVLPTMNKRDYSDDVKTVNSLTNVIKGQKFDTMNDMITYLEANGIDLQKLPSAYDTQYVWDQRQNAIITIDPSGKVCAAPDGYNKDLYLRNMVWKMVNLPSTGNSNKTIPHGVNISTFNQYSPYGQYLRDDQVLPAIPTIYFTCGIDVGKNDGLDLHYNYPASRTTTPIIKTNVHCDLTVHGSIENVVHYGKIRHVTIKDLNPEVPTSTYYEYGSVEGIAIIQERGKINVQPGGYINSVIFDIQNNLESGSYPLTIKKGATLGGRTKTIYTPNSYDQLMDLSELTEEEKSEIGFLTDFMEKYVDLDWVKTFPFVSGFGTKKSPYVIQTKTQFEFANNWINGTLSGEAQEYLPPYYLSQDTMVEGDLVTGMVQFSYKEHKQGIYFKLIDDIDLTNTATKKPGEIKPFIGIDPYDPHNPVGFIGGFDGNGYTIKNANVVNESQNSNNQLGLFASTQDIIKHNDQVLEFGGNKAYTQVSDIWDNETNALKPGAVDESNYLSVIKNINLENVTFDGIKEENPNSSCGSIVGFARNTLIKNCHVKGGLVTGCDNVGGLVGTMTSSVCQDCSIGDSAEGAKEFLVNAQSQYVGGLVGSSDHNLPQTQAFCASALINCKTGANVNVAFKEGEGVKPKALGGLLGQNQASLFVIDNCTNNAKVNDTVQLVVGYEDAGCVGGIVGNGQAIDIIANTTNNGSVKVDDKLEVYFMAGIAPQSKAKFVNVTNNGDVTGKALLGMAGISSLKVPGEVMHDPVKIELVNVTNNGKLTNSDETAPKANLVTGFNEILFENKTFANVEEINEQMKLLPGDAYYLTFKNCTVVDNSGTLNPTSYINYVKADTKICSQVNIYAGNRELYVDIPDIHLIVDKDSNLRLTCAGENSSVLIYEDASLGNVIMSGKNSILVNNGVINKAYGFGNVTISGENAELVNNGTIQGLTTFKGKSTDFYNFWECGRVIYEDDESSTDVEKTLYNYGDIVSTATETSEDNESAIYGNNIVSKITIEQHGLIEYKQNGKTKADALITLNQNSEHLNQSIINCYKAEVEGVELESIIQTDYIDNSGKPLYFYSSNDEGIKVQVKDSAKAIYTDSTQAEITVSGSQWASTFGDIQVGTLIEVIQ